MKAIKRLAEMKAAIEESATIEKFVSLTNPKNIVQSATFGPTP